MVYQLNNLSVSYANRVALQNVCCTIEEGKWVSVIGHTGAGKSTFVKVLKGLIPDIAGEYLINDHPVPKDRKGQLKTLPDIGYVFQYPEHQLFESTVYKELAFAPKLRGDTPQQIKKSIEAVLWQMGLTEDILPMVPFQLSGGQKRRVAIASVLMMDPKLLILDEPTAGLDPVAHSALLQRLSKWQRQGKRTVLFVSHQMNDVAEYSDEIMVFHEGQLRGHYETGTLFLRQAELLERLGLSLPEPVQLLKIVEEMSGEKIEVASCKEQDIFEKVLPIWQARRL